MFKELAPYLRQRAVLLTVTHLENDEIRVNIVPQKLKDGENAALTTPLTVTGTAEELDRDLSATVAAGLGIAKNGGAELLINKDASLLSGHAGSEGGLEAVIHHLLCGGNRGSLIGAQRASPTKHPCFE